MADAENKKLQGAPFENGMDVVRVSYDFDDDGGAVSVIDLLEMNDDAVLLEYYAVVETACTSGGSATLDVGVKGGDSDALGAAIAVASLSADSLHQAPMVEAAPNTAPMPLRLASGAILSMEIKVAAFTAGKVNFQFVFGKA